MRRQIKDADSLPTRLAAGSGGYIKVRAYLPVSN